MVKTSSSTANEEFHALLQRSGVDTRVAQDAEAEAQLEAEPVKSAMGLLPSSHAIGRILGRLSESILFSKWASPTASEAILIVPSLEVAGIEGRFRKAGYSSSRVQVKTAIHVYLQGDGSPTEFRQVVMDIIKADPDADLRIWKNGREMDLDPIALEEETPGKTETELQGIPY